MREKKKDGTKLDSISHSPIFTLHFSQQKEVSSLYYNGR